MNLQVVGCSHNLANVEIRERLVFPESKVPVFLKSFYDHFPEAEAVLLSTCNRTEFYAASKDKAALPSCTQMVQLLADQSGVGCSEIENQVFSYLDQDAIKHLFSVTARMDSMVVGETQILSQVKRAYEISTKSRSSISAIHKVFQNAIRVAKRISNETELHASRVSVPSVAICDLAKQIFETLKGKRVLVIGAGEMAKETLNYIRDEGCRDIVIVNRTKSNAQELAQEFDGTVGNWDNLSEELARADLVVATTGAEQPVVTAEMFQATQQQRRQASLFVLDLAVPRDFDSRIADAKNVYLYTLDDLQRECERNQRGRESHFPKAQKIIEQETGLFFDDARRREGGATIAQLKQQAHEVKEVELERLKNRLDVTPEQMEQIEVAFHRLTNKILHPPLKSLQADVSSERHGGLIDALKKLFQLGD